MITDTDHDDLRMLRDALEHAVSVIEGYEADIRNSAWTGIDLVSAGFCQGRIYTRAIETVRRMAGDEQRHRELLKAALRKIGP